MRTIMLMLGVFVLAGTGMCSAEGMTLRACYDLALRRSETVGIQKELVRETEALMLQSLSTALPRVAFVYSGKWQDEGRSNTFGGSTPEGKFTFAQPLFTGFKEFAAIAASRHIGKQRQLELKRAKELLLTDVADAFYLQLSYQAELGVQEDTHKTLADRVEELKRWQFLGKSRESEVASAEAKLARAEADIEVSRGQITMARQLMEFLTGEPVDALSDEKLADGSFDLQTLARKADDRADVMAARELLASYKNNIAMARSAFLPAVSLAGNSYTKRADAYEGNDWDATLTVEVPLLNGMGDLGQVRQARAQANQADLKLSQVRRRAMLEIKDAYAWMEAAYKRYGALQKAVLAARRNLTLQAEDFKKNLVNNLDVLQALEDLQAVRRQEVAARMDLGRGYWSLKVATGDIAGPAEQKK